MQAFVWPRRATSLWQWAELALHSPEYYLRLRHDCNPVHAMLQPWRMLDAYVDEPRR